jgi:hypothetical protein
MELATTTYTSFEPAGRRVKAQPKNMNSPRDLTRLSADPGEEQAELVEAVSEVAGSEGKSCRAHQFFGDPRFLILTRL